MTAVLAMASACGGHHSSSLATRQADFRNVENIIASTSKQCRTAVGSLSDGVHTLAASSGPVGSLAKTAQATVTACSQSGDEEIQDLATLTVPADLRGLRLEEVSRNLTAWAADAVSVGNDVIALAQGRDAAVLADFNAKATDMARLALASQSTLDAAAATVKVPSTPLALPTIGRPPS